MNPTLGVAYVEGKGLGVFALDDFSRGQVVERCYVYAIVDHCRAFERCGLDDYELAWGHKKVAFATGHAHLYNHSERPNVVFRRDLMRGVITVIALRRIRAGDELCHRYACAPWWREKS